MKKKAIISIILIVLVLLPIFAFGEKEAIVSSKKSSKKETVKKTETAPVVAPVKETQPATVVEEKKEEVKTTSDTSTSISTPMYKVELTEPTYITKEDIESAKESLSAYYNTSISDKDAVDYLVNQILLNQALSRALQNEEIPLYDGTFNNYVSYQLSLYASYYGINLTTQEEAESFLSQIGATYEDFANSVLQNYAQEYYIQAHSNGRLDNIAQPTAEEIQDFYNKNQDLFVSDPAAMLAHVYFDYGEDKDAAKKRAETALKNMNSGLPFEDAVITYSEDTATNANKGEFGVWVASTDTGAIESFGQSAMDEIFKLKVGEVSGVIEGVQGYHIVKILDYKKSELLGLNDQYNPNYNYTVSEVIADQLYSTKESMVYSEILDEIMTSLKKEATIKSLN